MRTVRAATQAGLSIPKAAHVATQIALIALRWSFGGIAPLQKWSFSIRECRRPCNHYGLGWRRVVRGPGVAVARGDYSGAARGAEARAP